MKKENQTKEASDLIYSELNRTLIKSAAKEGLHQSEFDRIQNELTRARGVADSLAVKKTDIRQIYAGVVKFQLAWIFGGIVTCLFADVSLVFAGFSGVAAIIGSYGYLYFAMGITKVETEVFAVPATSSPQLN